MSNLRDLEDKDIQQVLLAGGVLKRLNKSIESVTPEYKVKLRNKALKLLNSWKQRGVPRKAFTLLEQCNSHIINSFALKLAQDRADLTEASPIDNSNLCLVCLRYIFLNNQHV